jgi:2-oxoacid dehydrogenases acyltransferase (catalytic domain)
LFIYACAKMFHERPGVNRFVSGGRTYQRKDVWISFTAKKRLVDDSPLVTVKLKFPANEKFDDCMKRISDAVEYGRSGRQSPIDNELRLLTRLPGPVLRSVLAAGRWLDRFNLLPAALIEPDPLFTTLFLTNDGSVGVGNAHHHLYEYGTCSSFAVVGNVKKTVVVDRAGNANVREVLEVYWSFDERVNDGLYCANSLMVAQRLMEDPKRYNCCSDAPAEARGEGADMSRHSALREE